MCIILLSHLIVDGSDDLISTFYSSCSNMDFKSLCLFLPYSMLSRITMMPQSKRWMRRAFFQHAQTTGPDDTAA
jgi:hypothetical protein